VRESVPEAFFSTVSPACHVETRLDTVVGDSRMIQGVGKSANAARKSACATARFGAAYGMPPQLC
jgi:hypothetical protein